MRAVLLQVRAQTQANLDEFLRRLGQPPVQAEELMVGLWLLPLPECQSWLDSVRARLAQTLGVSATMREVDFLGPWQPVS